jgi:hypothetical protein
MKKAILFVLVLMMVGAAGAMLQITVNGDLNPADLEYSLSPGSPFLSLGVWTTDPIIGGGYFALLVLNSQGTITGGQSVFIPTPFEQWPAGPEEMNGIWGSTMPRDPIIYPILTGSVIAEGVLFRCTGSENAMIRLYALDENFTLDNLVDQVVIQVFNESITTPTVSKTTAAPAINNRVNGGREESFVASAAGIFDHVLEYKFNWGDGSIGPWGDAVQTHVYTYASAQTYNVTVQARCTVDGATSAVSAAMVLNTESVKSTAFFYDRWASYGRLSCWAFQRNCRGDTNNASIGIGANKMWVNSSDLMLLAQGFNKPESQMSPNYFCADFDRLCTGFGSNRSCVNSGDLAILAQYFNKRESLVPICAPTYYWYWTTGF